MNIKYMNNDDIRDACIRKDYEIFEKDKEIERLNNQLDFIKDQNKYIDKLEKMVKERNTIIKEAKECINHYAIEDEDYSKIYNTEEKALLEILDKGSDK